MDQVRPHDRLLHAEEPRDDKRCEHQHCSAHHRRQHEHHTEHRREYVELHLDFERPRDSQDRLAVAEGRRVHIEHRREQMLPDAAQLCRIGQRTRLDHRLGRQHEETEDVGRLKTSQPSREVPLERGLAAVRTNGERRMAGRG